MKKIILTVAAVFAFGFANAQEETTEGFKKGDVFISGAVGFGSTKTGDFKTSDFIIAPSAGYFVTENIAIGVALGYESSKIEFGGDDAKNNTFSVGAFGRYYFTPASKFSFFGQLGVNYNSYDNEFDLEAEELGEFKGDGFGVALAPGVNYFITKNLSLEATFGILGFETTKPDADGAEKTNSFDFGLDTRDIRLGLVYKF
ncbi:Autotransporter beta-domain protein [compost metagenome]|uniref:Opacity protein-like surface antigen n=1 Tax=Flavobacterium endophyticum TaxID=1540163 RepID=A0A495MHV4_9FLAO|nr:outer membrane beta-barrel protein [Flavobacterium endophyticum]RKS25591.1 opacity protein-like surface antigen [Flavobacterium endophyticum]